MNKELNKFQYILFLFLITAVYQIIPNEEIENAEAKNLSYAIMVGNVAQVKKILKNNPAIINEKLSCLDRDRKLIKDKFNCVLPKEKPLIRAIKQDNFELITLLLENNASVDPDDLPGEDIYEDRDVSPLITALHNPKVVDLLLKNDANPNKAHAKPYLDKPLWSAAICCHELKNHSKQLLESAKLLIENGATNDSSCKEPLLATALRIGCHSQTVIPQIIDLFVQIDQDVVDFCDEDGTGLIEFAVLNKHFDTEQTIATIKKIISMKLSPDRIEKAYSWLEKEKREIAIGVSHRNESLIQKINIAYSLLEKMSPNNNFQANLNENFKEKKETNRYGYSFPLLALAGSILYWLKIA